MKYLFATIIAFTLPLSTFAARFYFNPAEVDTTVGNEFKVDLMFDPEGADINALELNLSYSDSIFPKSVSLGGSFVTLWLKNPEISNGKITLVGIVPGGFEGVIDPDSSKLGPGVVASLVLHSASAGDGLIKIDSAKATRNDGRATPIVAQWGSLKVTSVGEASSTNPYDYQDTIPPAVFKPQIIQSKYLFDGKYALVFSTQDKESGLDHYEVAEGSGDFRQQRSPYLLEDQTLSSIIRVRAIDVAGNERTVTLDPHNKFAGVPLPLPYLVAGFVLLALIIIWHLRKRRS